MLRFFVNRVQQLVKFRYLKSFHGLCLKMLRMRQFHFLLLCVLIFEPAMCFRFLFFSSLDKKLYIIAKTSLVKIEFALCEF